MWRGVFTAAAMAVGLIAASADVGRAQTYPARTITLVVPFQPGGATDAIARLVAQHLGKELGQTVIVENKPAASGIVGSAGVASSPPDGYTLLLASLDTLVLNAHLHKKLPFDPLQDFAPIAMLADAPSLIVINASSPARNLREFIELARASPDGFNYGSPGAGTMPHMNANHFARMIGAKMVHIPFRGSAAAVTEVATGGIQMTLAIKASADGLAQAGKVKYLAVASMQRLDSLPDVPTVAEAGLPGYQSSNWFGVVAPRGTSPEIIARLNASLQRLFDDPANAALLTRQGIQPVRGSVADFAAHIRSEYQRWKTIVAESGVQAQ